MARSVSLGYFMLAFSHGMGGVLRGGGRSFPGFHDYNDNLMVWTESSITASDGWNGSAAIGSTVARSMETIPS